MPVLRRDNKVTDSYLSKTEHRERIHKGVHCGVKAKLPIDRNRIQRENRFGIIWVNQLFRSTTSTKAVPWHYQGPWYCKQQLEWFFNTHLFKLKVDPAICQNLKVCRSDCPASTPSTYFSQWTNTSTLSVIPALLFLNFQLKHLTVNINKYLSHKRKPLYQSSFSFLQDAHCPDIPSHQLLICKGLRQRL